MLLPSASANRAAVKKVERASAFVAVINFMVSNDYPSKKL
jgi:hypothetical protein